MKQYALLSDAMLDGAKLAPQIRDGYFSEDGTCAVGAALHAIDGEPSAEEEKLCSLFPFLTDVAEACPVHSCSRSSVIGLIVHLNDVHEWSREQIAGWLATIEAKLGMVEIVSDTTTAQEREAETSAVEYALP